MRTKWYCYTAATITRSVRPALADQTNAAKRNVEDEQRVYCNPNTTLDHARAAHDAHACCQRPGDQYQVDGYLHNDANADRAEDRGDDEREERVADDGDGLEEGTRDVSKLSAGCSQVHSHVASQQLDL